MFHVLENEIVIVSAARTPVGRFRGALSDFDAIDLGALAIGEALSRARLDPAAVDTVNMGMVVSAGYGLAPAKAAAVKAGLPAETHTRAVESVCGSAMDAMALAMESLLVGTARVAVAGGMESRTNAPYLVGPTLRRNSANYKRGQRLSVKRAGAYRFQLSENAEEQLGCTGLVDPTSYDGLFWAAEKTFMREYALDYAAAHGILLEDVNRYAAESHRKAREAVAKGLFRDEIVPAGSVGDDDLVPEERLKRELEESPDDLASLYNSSTPADAGAAVVLTTGSRARELGLEPMARVMGYARVDGPPSEYLIAPVKAAEMLFGELEAAGRPTDFTIAEANEAFGIQLPLFHRAFEGVDINVHGGAIALGHPLGSAGARITTTLLYAMKRYGHRRGFSAICYGGGGAYALAVEMPG
ncbi:MAG TPA: thiolase family protein [Armatimonadota bacterium]|nr:thiolase family protein [Armatimonadota bacterium]